MRAPAYPQVCVPPSLPGDSTGAGTQEVPRADLRMVGSLLPSVEEVEAQQEGDTCRGRPRGLVTTRLQLPCCATFSHPLVP